MSISNHMAANVAQLQQSLGVAMLKSAQSTQAAQATKMLDDFKENQGQIKLGEHPHLGKKLDIKV